MKQTKFKIEKRPGGYWLKYKWKNLFWSYVGGEIGGCFIPFFKETQEEVVDFVKQRNGILIKDEN